jgi:hypothetical protein
MRCGSFDRNAHISTPNGSPIKGSLSSFAMAEAPQAEDRRGNVQSMETSRHRFSMTK